jgi:hypothetical protein
MARQSFIWTALPNGYTADQSGLRLSVMLAPRLDPQDPSGQPHQLSTFFPDWQDWPSTLANARFDVAYGGQTVSVLATTATGANRVDNRLGLADSAVWKAIFHGDLKVKGFAFKDLSDKHILSYDTVILNGLVERLYRDLARTAADRMPLVSEFIETPDWRNLIALIATIDQHSINSDSGLRDPRKQFGNLRWGRAALLTTLAAPNASDPQSPAVSETLQRLQMFHTPPATPIERHEKRADDKRIDTKRLEYQRTQLPKKEDIAKQLEFHQVVAAMGSYPTLLRRLGLVVDLVLAPSSFTPSSAADLSVKVVFPTGTLQIPRTADAGPATSTRLTTTRFDAVPAAGAAMPLRDGLLDLDATRYQLLQLDVDGAGLKLMNFVRSLGRRMDVDARVDPVTRHEDEIGAPAVRTGGLMLVQRARSTVLTQRLVANKDRNAKFEGQFAGAVNTVPLHAEDVVRGYRIDIWDSTTGQWQSLCRRTAQYQLNGAGLVVQPTPEEESIVRLASTTSADQTSNQDLIYLHEALMAWTGWSLAAPPPGRSIRPDDSFDNTSAESEAEVPPGLDFKSRFEAVKGSLPRLRFGRAYWVRARAVDLAGNSLDPRLLDFGGEHPATHARPYLRYEPVAAPIVALLSAAGSVEKPAEGESMRRIAIRSFNATPGDNAVPSSQVGHRVAAPPQVSARDAEQHGMLDRSGKVDASLFNMLANEKDVAPTDSAAAIREVQLPMQGPLDAQPVSTTYAVYESGRALTYLPDPLAIEVAARIFDHPNIANTEIIRIPLYAAGGGWPDAQPFTIEVYDDPAGVPDFDAAARQLRVPLPKAVRARIRLSMTLTNDALAVMGVFNLLADADRTAQRQRAANGQHWMLTPWTVIDVVHAVQRPLRLPEVSTLSILGREMGQTSARPRMSVTCSVDSTDRLDLFAEWHDPIDDHTIDESKSEPADRVRRDAAFQVKVTGPKDYADATKGARAGGFPDHTILGKDLIGINDGHDERLPRKAHEFHDTRYRRIEYWFDGTTRFREYLPNHVLTTVKDGTRVPSDEQIKVTGPRAVTWIPSSAPPPAPKVLYVVPTFGWTRSVDEHGVLSSWRRGGGLRVYLDRPWNASGYGEMLGVLLPPSAFEGDSDTSPSGAPYKKYVTLWGNDPIWASSFVPGVAPTLAHFPLARTAPDPTGKWLPPNAPDAEKDQRPGPFLIKGLRPPSSDQARMGAVDVAPHDVFYDSQRQLWYCDIEIESGASYFPFIRLALARYQPASIENAHLSNVVLADIMSLSADRWLNVTPAADAPRLRVAVFGVNVDESSAHREAKDSVAFSQVNVLTGTVDERRPATVSERNVVEVWVERLDPRLGEDFGWQRTDHAVISRRIPAAPSSPLQAAKLESVFGRGVTEVERVTAAKQPSIHGETVLQPAHVIDKVQLWQTLWEGDVTLPAPAAGVRYRLVIAEYEQYIVDNDHPYDRTPTKAARRLVFVEHVELT